MVLNISDRIKRILKAQVLDLLDIPDADAAVSDETKEIDDALNIVRAELGRVLARRHRLSKTLPGAEQARAEMAGKAETALSHDAEGLARAAIARRLELDTHITDIRADIACTEAEARDLEEIIERLNLRAGRHAGTAASEFAAFERAMAAHAMKDPSTGKGQ